MFCVGKLLTLTTHRPRVGSYTPVQKRCLLFRFSLGFAGSTETVWGYPELGRGAGRDTDMWNRKSIFGPPARGACRVWSLPHSDAENLVMLACPFCYQKSVASKGYQTRLFWFNKENRGLCGAKLAQLTQGRCVFHIPQNYRKNTLNFSSIV